MLSTIVFRSLKRRDGVAVSRQKAVHLEDDT
jgi:hypothetical protein